MTSEHDDFAVVEAGPGSVAPVEDEASGGPSTDLPDDPVVRAMRDRFGGEVLRHQIVAGDEHVVYVEPGSNVDILRWLHDDADMHFDHLADLTAVDYGGGRPLEVVYQLWSIPHKRALRVKCELPLDGLEIDSVTGIWSGANWLEREVLDLFGIAFRGHPDPRRILMPEDYGEGHPLRKDFPLRGRFSRAEQTRRALNAEPEHHYRPEELGERVPQTASAEDLAEDE